jgi:HEPN domain-containing protein
MTGIPNRAVLDSRLRDLDREFRSQGIPLRYRPLACFKSLYGTNHAAPEREALFNPVAAWFHKEYGEQVAWDGVIGKFPVFLRGEVYLVSVPFTSADAIVKLTDRIEGFSSVKSGPLMQDEFEDLGRVVAGMTPNVQSLYDLSVEDGFLDDVERGLIWRGIFDLENGATALKTSGDTQTAIFHAHEAAEKFLKVALKRTGGNPNLRSLGHRIRNVFDELLKKRPAFGWLRSSVDSLRTLAPDMEIRYAQVPRSPEHAISALYASLSICGTLALVWLFEKDRGSPASQFKAGKFYMDGSRTAFYCCGGSTVPGKPPLVLLLRFGSGPFVSNLIAEVLVEHDVSMLYLEVRDKRRIHALQQRLNRHRQNPGTRLSQEDLGLKITSGPEGCYATSIIRLKTNS